MSCLNKIIQILSFHWFAMNFTSHHNEEQWKEHGLKGYVLGLWPCIPETQNSAEVEKEKPGIG